MTELKPCPFCGRKSACWSESKDHEGLGTVVCLFCGARGPDSLNTEMGNTAVWNRRPSDSDTRNGVIDEACEPEWTCSVCGNRLSGNFKGITYRVAGEPDEFDIECLVCGSTNVAESPGEALDEAIDHHQHTLDKIRDQAETSLIEMIDQADRMLGQPNTISALLTDWLRSLKQGDKP